MPEWPDNPLLSGEQHDLARRVPAFAREEIGPPAEEAGECPHYRGTSETRRLVIARELVRESRRSRGEQ